MLAMVISWEVQMMIKSLQDQATLELVYLAIVGCLMICLPCLLILQLKTILSMGLVMTLLMLGMIFQSLPYMAKEAMTRSWEGD